jgi:hypothetical protein
MKQFIKKYSSFVLNETLKTHEISFVINKNVFLIKLPKNK